MDNLFIVQSLFYSHSFMQAIYDQIALKTYLRQIV